MPTQFFQMMIIYKGQAFDLSGKVTHIGVPSKYQNIVFSKTSRPIEFKFYMKTPYKKYKLFLSLD